MIALDKSSNQSTQVAFLLMEAMAEIGEPVALTELARRLGMPKPRAFRFLKTLLSMGYVLQDPETDRYRLSLKLFHLGQAVADRTVLLTEARPLMVQLRDQTQQTVTLSLVEAQGMRILDMVRAASPVQIVTRPGALLDFHSSAQGKLALAFGDPSLWDVVRSEPLRKWTPKTNTDLVVLEKTVELIRKRGWADAPEETLPGVNALSAPIFDMTRQMIATVNIAGPVTTLTTPPEQTLIDAIRMAARSISRNLGFTEPSK
jgi:DNA-binding IclR family transcriptional regulator